MHKLLGQTFLFQLDFSALLREGARATQPGGEAITYNVATDAVGHAGIGAITNLRALVRDRVCHHPNKTNLEDPTMTTPDG